MTSGNKYLTDERRWDETGAVAAEIKVPLLIIIIIINLPVPSRD